VRALILIPAYNESESLPAVVRELRTHAPGIDILVVDDGSVDDTPSVLPCLGVQWLRLPVQLGVGAAVRTGLRYAHTRGYDAVVRLDGDGQHPARLVQPLLAPLQRDDADVVIGSRYAARPRPAEVPFVRRLLHYLLGRILSVLTGRLVTDPTSGLWAFGPRAVELLAEHHPSGYPEPELMLFVSRNALRTIEIPVEMRLRKGGQSSLTLHRTGAAMLRLLVLLAVVPLRSAVKGRR
jgi:glycosyltransferase involved in cell wall biosynthesis